MSDPNQVNFFYSKINGKTRKFKHRNTHKSNDRQIALVKFLEANGLSKQDDCLEIKRAFNTGYNMGYKESRKRTTQILNNTNEVQDYSPTA